MPTNNQQKKQPPVCIPWQDKMKELPEIIGDKELIKRIWQDNDALAYVYIWHCLVSF